MFQRKMTLAVNPIEVSQAVDQWNFYDEVCINLPRRRRSRGGKTATHQLKCHQQRWSPLGRPWPRGYILKYLVLASKVKSLASQFHVLANCSALGSRLALFLNR